VAAGIGPLSIGTDGGGSVRIPAACTGLVGLKATYGRIPAWPASMHGDLANTGPMTRTTRDAALMLNVLKGADVRDPLALPPTDVDFVAALDRGVKGLKVGLVLKFGDFYLDPEVEAAMLKAADRFRALGCEVVPITPPTENGETGRIFVAHWFAALQRLLHLYPEARHDEFDPALYEQAKIGAGLDVKTIMDSQVRRREMAHAWNQVFAEYDLAARIAVPGDEPRGRHVWNQFVIRVLDDSRDALRAQLAARGVGTEIYYPVPLHLQECFEYLGQGPGSLPVSEACALETIALPIFPELKQEQLQAVVDGILAFLRA
jgi:Asp-tRNA(Asn)/Glu-tRNA(Gln) amidotransferase A subunit family amidase